MPGRVGRVFGWGLRPGALAVGGGSSDLENFLGPRPFSIKFWFLVNNAIYSILEII
jgi:hypothetical protein